MGDRVSYLFAEFSHGKATEHKGFMVAPLNHSVGEWT